MSRLTDNWVNGGRIIVALVAFLWGIEMVNTTLNHELSMFGVLPREWRSLPGVFFWPFLHANVQHLILNTTPLLVMGFFVALRGPGVFLKTTIMITVLGGIGIWVFGRHAVHIGASGLVFGYFGFLVAVGIYEKSLASLAIASFTLFYYGGLIFGVLPVDSFISWEAHLFGLLAGVYAAGILAIKRRRRE